MVQKRPDNNLRLRIFAGPNGSGKSTVIRYVRNYVVNGRAIDFGYYINADDIAVKLIETTFSFADYDVATNLKDFVDCALASGLIGDRFSASEFRRSFSFSSGNIKLRIQSHNEVLAQIVADFLRKKYLTERRKFSFETVFSHPSKLGVIREAVNAGYKVYLYFVSTESPRINVFRVKARKAKGGHDVPEDKIVDRYYRSLGLLKEAIEMSYQAFFFDNSNDGEDFKLFAHFKKISGKKKWDKLNKRDVPKWFLKYYSEKT